MGTTWQYEDARGVTVTGTYERCIDRGGTDVTYYTKAARTLPTVELSA